MTGAEWNQEAAPVSLTASLYADPGIFTRGMDLPILSRTWSVASPSYNGFPAVGDSLSCRSIAVRIFPVMPDKTRIYTAQNCAVVTTLCRTIRPVPVECRPGVPHEIPLATTKCSPDLFKVFSGHAESFSVLRNGNAPHPSEVFSWVFYNISRKYKR